MQRPFPAAARRVFVLVIFHSLKRRFLTAFDTPIKPPRRSRNKSKCIDMRYFRPNMRKSPPFSHIRRLKIQFLRNENLKRRRTRFPPHPERKAPHSAGCAAFIALSSGKRADQSGIPHTRRPPIPADASRPPPSETADSHSCARPRRRSR